jgi:hypothetical protein
MVELSTYTITKTERESNQSKHYFFIDQLIMHRMMDKKDEKTRRLEGTWNSLWSTISPFTSKLKMGDDSGTQPNEASAFRKIRSAYILNPIAGDISPQKVDPIPMPPKEKAVRPKRTRSYFSPEIGAPKDKKKPFVSSLMGTFSCHGTLLFFIVHIFLS